MTPKTAKQLLWSKIHRHPAVGILARHDQMRRLADPIDEWATALHAHAGELLARVVETGSTQDAEAALNARHAAEGAHIIAKAAREGISARAYRFLETPANQEVFRALAESIAVGLAKLPPATARADVLARADLGQRFRPLGTPTQNPHGIGGDSYFAGVVRYYGELAEMPAPEVPVPGERMPISFRGTSDKPAPEPRRHKWATLFKGEPLSPAIQA